MVNTFMLSVGLQNGWPLEESSSSLPATIMPHRNASNTSTSRYPRAISWCSTQGTNTTKAATAVPAKMPEKEIPYRCVRCDISVCSRLLQS